jgi:hypothetical protein
MAQNLSLSKDQYFHTKSCSIMAVTITGGEIWGMAIYEIRPDGNIIGRWNNNGMEGPWALHFEIARKIEEPNELPGIYAVSWIEEAGNSIQGTLEIRSVRHAETEWIWREDDVIIFRGTGLQIGPTEITVVYWQEIPPRFNNPA